MTLAGFFNASRRLSGSRGIRVVYLSLLGVGLEILESIVRHTTIASHVSVVGAGDKLLLREAQKVASGNGVSRLNNSSG